MTMFSCCSARCRGAAWRILLAGALALSTAACPADDPSVTDAGPDEGIDGGGADAAGPCFEDLTHEALVTGWVSGEPIPGVTLALAGGDDTDDTSPNGRGILCLPASTRTGLVEYRHPDYVARADQVHAATHRAVSASRSFHRARLLSPAEADEIFTAELGIARDTASAQVLIEVRRLPDDVPLEGATVALGGVEYAASYTGGPGNAFGAGDTLTGDDVVVLFANVEATVDSASLTVTPPGSFSGTCTGPDRVTLQPGVFTRALVVCE